MTARNHCGLIERGSSPAAPARGVPAATVSRCVAGASSPDSRDPSSVSACPIDTSAWRRSRKREPSACSGPVVPGVAWPARGRVCPPRSRRRAAPDQAPEPDPDPDPQSGCIHIKTTTSVRAAPRRAAPERDTGGRVAARWTSRTADPPPMSDAQHRSTHPRSHVKKNRPSVPGSRGPIASLTENEAAAPAANTSATTGPNGVLLSLLDVTRSRYVGAQQWREELSPRCLVVRQVAPGESSGSARSAVTAPSAALLPRVHQPLHLRRSLLLLPAFVALDLECLPGLLRGVSLV